MNSLYFQEDVFYFLLWKYAKICKSVCFRRLENVDTLLPLCRPLIPSPSPWAALSLRTPRLSCPSFS